MSQGPRALPTVDICIPSRQLLSSHAVSGCRAACVLPQGRDMGLLAPWRPDCMCAPPSLSSTFLVDSDHHLYSRLTGATSGAAGFNWFCSQDTGTVREKDKMSWTGGQADHIGDCTSYEDCEAQSFQPPESEVLVAQSNVTLCDSMECSSPGSPVHGVLQVRILE